MGGAVSISRTSAAEKQKAAAKGKDQRRKNSFAFHLTKFIKNEENDVQLLHRLCKSERDSALLKLQKNNRDASEWMRPALIELNYALVSVLCAVLCCAVLCCAVLYCAVLRCTVLCCTVLYCTVLHVCWMHVTLDTIYVILNWENFRWFSGSYALQKGLSSCVY